MIDPHFSAAWMPWTVTCASKPAKMFAAISVHWPVTGAVISTQEMRSRLLIRGESRLRIAVSAGSFAPCEKVRHQVLNLILFE